MFDLKWVSDNIDEIIQKLSEYSEREPEIKATVGVMLAAKRLIATYSDRMLEEPQKSVTVTKRQVAPDDRVVIGTQGMWLASLAFTRGRYADAIETTQEAIGQLHNYVSDTKMPYSETARDLVKKINSSYNVFIGALNEYIALASEQAKKRP